VPTQVAKPKAKTEYEFFGPIGVTVIMIALPVVTFLLYGFCNDRGCSLWPPTLNARTFAPFWRDQTFLSWDAAFVVVGWLVAHAVAHLVVPGETVRGLTLDDGGYYTYKMNGLATMFLFTAVLSAGQYYGWIDLAWVHDHLLELLTTTLVIVLALCVYIYLVSFRPGERLARSGNTGTSRP